MTGSAPWHLTSICVGANTHGPRADRERVQGCPAIAALETESGLHSVVSDASTSCCVPVVPSKERYSASDLGTLGTLDRIGPNRSSWWESVRFSSFGVGGRSDHRTTR